MHLEVLVEELSAEVALRNILPRIVSAEVTFEIRTFEGKHNLLARLPDRLRGYARWIDAADTRVVVLIDEDREDCQALKQQLEDAAAAAGLATKTVAAPGGPFFVLNRIAIEELEAWFFGDGEALTSAYPGVPGTLAARAPFRDPDAVVGGTWERLEKVLQRAGYHRAGPRQGRGGWRRLNAHGPSAKQITKLSGIPDGSHRSCSDLTPSRSASLAIGPRLFGLYAFEWGARVRIRGGAGRFGQVTPPVWSSTRSR